MRRRSQRGMPCPSQTPATAIRRDAGRRGVKPIEKWQQLALPVMRAEKRLEIVGAQIDSLAVLTAFTWNCPAIRDGFQTLATHLNDAWITYLEAAHALSPAVETELRATVTGTVESRLEGIRRMLAGEDDGASLRQAVSQRGGVIGALALADWAGIENQQDES
jgi:hypothetical protein